MNNLFTAIITLAHVGLGKLADENDVESTGGTRGIARVLLGAVVFLAANLVSGDTREQRMDSWRNLVSDLSDDLDRVVDIMNDDMHRSGFFDGGDKPQQTVKH